MAKCHFVTLDKHERIRLQQLLLDVGVPERKKLRARVFLLSDQSVQGPSWQDKQISQELGVSIPTIERWRLRFREFGLEAALERKPRSAKFSQEISLQLVAIKNSPTLGNQEWSLRQLAEQMVLRGHVESISHESVRKILTLQAGK